MVIPRRPMALIGAGTALLAAACGATIDEPGPVLAGSAAAAAADEPTAPATTTTTPATSATTAGSGPTGSGATTGATGTAGGEAGPAATTDLTRPVWLGQRVLPTTPDGQVVPQTTPQELRNRRLPTVDTLPPPPTAEFTATTGPVPADVLARSTWREGCPVEPGELTYLIMTFWGFDDRPHTGEMIVNAAVADDVVAVFRQLFETRFPIEEMRVVSEADVDAPPTGDGNNTTSFVCRSVTGGSRFSEHAFGLAIDINPFHNPYRRGEVVIPELAGAYLDRSAAPGVVTEDDVVVRAFDAIGWGWGGRWTSPLDYQHFSLHGR